MSSIRDGARNPPRGDALRLDSSYQLDYFRQADGGSGSQNEDGARADLAERFEDVGLPDGAEAAPQRHCYCDTPVPVDCAACVADQFCMSHPFLQCSGDCGRWIHARCAGWIFVSGPGGGEDGAYVVSSWDPDLCIPLSDVSQGEHPWYCIKCWEARKRDRQANSSPVPFESLGIDEKARRLGLDLDATQTVRAHRQQINRRHEEIAGFINDPSLFQHVLSNSPRPFPTTRPMDNPSRQHQAFRGRQFELSMLCFEVKACDCCGITEATHADSQMPSKNACGPFRRAHLATSFHPAWYCDCIGVCGGGQFYGARKTKEMEWFKAQHDTSDPTVFFDRDEPNATLCDGCYLEINNGKDVTLLLH